MIPTNRRPLSHIARERLAKEAAEARHLDRTDEGNILRRRVRTEMVALTQTANMADREWHKLHDPVSAPASVGRGQVHPSRAEALRRYAVEQGWSEDPLEPVVELPTLADLLEAATAETKARLAEAQAAYEAYERGEPDPVALETVPVDEPVRRGRGRSGQFVALPE